MATLLPLGQQQFFSATGFPLALGSVAFYVPGTTTPKDTWQDQAQAALNTNPVLLDIAGRAVIWGVGAYRQIVKDQAGNTIWDQVVQGVGDLSGNTGSNSVGFAQSATYGAGTIGEWLKFKGYQNNAANITTSVTYTSGAGTYPYQDYNHDIVQYGQPLTPVTPVIGNAAYYTPFVRAAYINAGHLGGLQTGMFIGQIRGAPQAGQTNYNYTPLQTFMSVTTNLGGTGTTMATGKGQLFGMGLLAVAYSGATNLLNVTGAEVNVQMSSGSSVAYKSGLQITAMPQDAVQGTTYDAALSLSNQAGAVGFKNGILFSGANGTQSVTTTGTLIGVQDNPTAANGVNLNGATFTGNAFASNQFAVDGSGNVSAHQYVAGYSGALVRLGTAGVASTLGVQFLSSGATAGTYDAALTGFGGSGAQGNGGIGIDASVFQPASDNTTAIGVISKGFANVYSWQLQIPERSAASVSTPAAGTQALFIDTADHKLKRKDSSGTVTVIA